MNSHHAYDTPTQNLNARIAQSEEDKNSKTKQTPTSFRAIIIQMMGKAADKFINKKATSRKRRWTLATQTICLCNTLTLKCLRAKRIGAVKGTFTAPTIAVIQARRTSGRASEFTIVI